MRYQRNFTPEERAKGGRRVHELHPELRNCLKTNLTKFHNISDVQRARARKRISHEQETRQKLISEGWNIIALRHM